MPSKASLVVLSDVIPHAAAVECIPERPKRVVNRKSVLGRGELHGVSSNLNVRVS